MTATAKNAAMVSEGRTGWAWALATVVGVGNLRPGPGTYGSAVAVALWFVATHVAQSAVQASAQSQAIGTLLAALAVTAIGIPAATIVARESGKGDPQFVVIDEVAGQLFALIAIPADWKHALLAFALFRLFDIWKPWPVRRLEKLHGGLGIVLDDVAAGLLALALGFLLPILFIAIRFWVAS